MIQVVTPRNEGDWHGYAAAIAQSFGRSAGATLDWLMSTPVQGGIVRVAVDDETVVGGAMVLRLGQLFGGRSVSAGAITDIAVLPEHRGRGLGATLLRALDGPMKEAGIAVSPLWPTTLWLYRRMGWEVAGRAERHTVSARSLARLGGPGRAVPSPGPQVRELQSRWAGEWNGPIDRPGWWWAWRESPREGVFRYAWEEAGRTTGYLAYEQSPEEDRRHHITVTDLWTATPAALNGLLGLLGSHGAQVAEIAFAPSVLPVVHDLLWLAPGAEVRSAEHGPWMLRLVDPPAAVAARGWSSTAEGRVELSIRDPGSERTGSYVLEVSGGRGSLEPGGSGAVSIGAGALAAWYSGGLTARRAARLGLAGGSEADLQAMDTLTADRPTWLPDVF